MLITRLSIATNGMEICYAAFMCRRRRRVLNFYQGVRSRTQPEHIISLNIASYDNGKRESINCIIYYYALIWPKANLVQVAQVFPNFCMTSASELRV